MIKKYSKILFGFCKSLQCYTVKQEKKSSGRDLHSTLIKRFIWDKTRTKWKALNRKMIHSWRECKADSPSPMTSHLCRVQRQFSFPTSVAIQGGLTFPSWYQVERFSTNSLKKSSSLSMVTLGITTTCAIFPWQANCHRRTNSSSQGRSNTTVLLSSFSMALIPASSRRSFK